MNLAELIRVIGRRWLVIVIFTLIGIFFSALAVYKPGSGGLEARNSGYCSTASTMIDQPGVGGAAAGAVLARLLAVPQTYKIVIESSEISVRASELLDGKYTPKEIESTTNVEPILLTQVMKIKACGDTPADAPLVTDAVVVSFRDWLNERQDQHNVLGPNRILLTVLSAPQVPDGPSGFPAWMWVFLGAFLGVTFGLITAFGVESLAREEDIVAAKPQNVRRAGNGNGFQDLAVTPPAAAGMEPLPDTLTDTPVAEEAASSADGWGQE